MRVAISNLAWDVSDDERVADLLKAYSIDAIDIAPGKYFVDPGGAVSSAAVRIRDWWSARGISIVAMQALLFGTTGLNMFGTEQTQSVMLAHLGHICRIGEVLGVSRLVFGSPRSRDRGALADEEVLGMAVAFFRRLGDIAAGYSMQVCLEPNPPCYGANFMTCSEETAAVVMAVSHPAIRMQLDTGAIAINGEDPEEIVREYAHLIGHVHASEPNLVVLGDAHADHAAVAASLRAYLPDQIVSIEMLASKGEASITAIERAVGVAIAHYGADYGRERYSPKRSP